MNRRYFLRVIGGTAFTCGVAPRYLFANEGSGAAGVLIEASTFDDLGGWVIDTQFYQQMGGCFLLAHGMGVPVANAKTKFILPEGGKWRAWVRTRNWCPGEWEAPGRFKVKVDGKDLEPMFGTQPGWAWQAGGAIDLEAGRHTLELEDLTGFDGRCDGVFFTKEENPDLPNEDLVQLAAWKDRVSGRADLQIPEDAYDLVIIGGGLSGCGAALAARKHGLKVALVQDRPLFGGCTSEEIRVHTLGIYGKGEDIISKIDTTVHYPNGDEMAKKDQLKRERTMEESGAELFRSHIAVGLGKDGDTLTTVEARDVRTGRLRRFRAPIFIDATGDAWLGYWAGADYRYGRESKHEFGEGWDRYGERWSPDEADNKILGSSIIWNSERGTQRSLFPAVPWAVPVAKDHEAINGDWYWEYSADHLNQVNDAEQIRDHLLRAIFGAFSNAKRHPKNATVQLKWVAFVAGKRESRRLMGDYIYTMQDATEHRDFPDTVVEEKRALDGHYQRSDTGSPYDFLSNAMFLRLEKAYFIPFRCFYSRNIPNLMMAGRCFSCSHVGLSGPRVMRTTAQMGVATGFAAVVCKKHNALPREVGEKHIGELRQLIGYEA